MAEFGDRGLGHDRLSSGYRGGRRYDPNQPRVPRGHPDGGQWTDDDGVPARSSPVPSPVAVPAPAAPLPSTLPLGIGAGMAGIAASAFAAAMTMFSRSAGKVQEGELRHFSGLRYRYDEGFLTVFSPASDGTAELLFHGRADKDGLFRTGDGRVLAAANARSVLLNEVGIVDLRRRRVERSRARLGLETDAENPRLCPASTPERPTRDMEDFDVDWRLYQHQVTGLPIGWAVQLREVEFDGCIDLDGTMQEAKGPNYANKIEDGDFKAWFRRKNDLVKQLVNQSVAAEADGRIVVWYAAEQPMADLLARYVEALGLTNVFVTHRPYRRPGSER